MTALPNASNKVDWTTSQTGALQRTLTYRPGGDLAQDSHAGSTVYAYTYNAAKRMVEVKQNGTQEGGYAYDFAGRRVWRETYGTGAAQTAYIYDPRGHLLAEENASTGAVNREYAWIDDMPVALLIISGSTVATDFIHTGQIDEPLAVTNSSQALVWNAYVDPYGIATTIGTPSITFDMRLPGQSIQTETNNLSQNHWRDYDPSLGRYAEGDPLGIDAGQNIYAYVDGDPLNLVDRRGLLTWAQGLGLAGAGIAAVGTVIVGGGPEDPIAVAIAANILRGALAGEIAGGTIDFGVQVISNGGNLNCVNYSEVGETAIAGSLIGAGVGGLTAAASAAAAEEAGSILPSTLARVVPGVGP